MAQSTQVHFNTSMSPLELEMYHQIKNVIGVNPTFFDYLFTVDADTIAEPYSVNCLILVCVCSLVFTDTCLLSLVQVHL